MLRRLSLSNFVIVSRLDVDFGPGFAVLTGETGAGKSILIDALQAGGRSAADAHTGAFVLLFALQAASLDAWFAELVRRIMFVGFFAFVLDRGPALAKAIVDSLFQIGAGGGSASPANVFNAGLSVAAKMSEKISFGVFQDNALALSASLAMIVSVIAFSLVAAIFLSVLVEMYVGLLAGMILLGVAPCTAMVFVWSQLVKGDPNYTLDGVPVAFEGHRTSCGARLLASGRALGKA